MKEQLKANCLDLLKRLIQTPSFSRKEEDSAAILEAFYTEYNLHYFRKKNNIWMYNKYFDESKPTILLNSHHDTVMPNPGYSRDPFAADIEDGKLFGLGSNDAGGCLVSLIATFIYYYECEDLRYNLCLATTAEEEISGREGLEMIIPDLGNLDFAIVGEPTQLNLAIAERGLMVFDCVAHGKAGHAAREEGENAIYKALNDIEWFRSFRFPKESKLFGPIKMSVTVINAGSQHNVVPAKCEFTVDVRVTDVYSNEEVLDIVRSHVSCDVNPRSVRLKPSSISETHPVVKAGLALGKVTYGSPTTSDQALLSIPSLKVGPGDSARSHMADEFIYVEEVKEGIDFYIALLQTILEPQEH